MLRHERFIGIVSSWDIRRKDSEGYSLLITDGRLVGAYRAEYPDDFWVYVQPGSEPGEEIRAKALVMAEKIITAKDFEMHKGNIIKIILDEPSELSGGRLLIKGTGRQVELQVTIRSLLSREIALTVDTLLNSLLAFAPELVYSEKSGARIEKMDAGR